MRTRPDAAPSRALSTVDVTAVVLLTPVALLAWATAFSGGPYGGGLLYALLLSPVAAPPLVIAGALRLAGRRSAGTGRWVALALTLTLAGVGAVPAVAALEERGDRERRQSVAEVLEQVTARCAAAAVAQVPEPAEDEQLRTAMLGCMQGPGSDRLRREVGWQVQCERAGCSAYAAHGLRQEPLLVGLAGYLDAALVEAGRPGWTRFRQPGDPAPRRGVSGIDRTG